MVNLKVSLFSVSEKKCLKISVEESNGTWCDEIKYFKLYFKGQICELIYLCRMYFCSKYNFVFNQSVF